MAGIAKKNIDSPDETRKFAANGHVDVLELEGVNFGRATFEPGWRWSNDVKPIAGTESCQVHHNGYVVSGRMRIMMDDGSSEEVGPGDLFVAVPGHDAEVLGSEPCIVFDFSSAAADYAKASS